jgi:DNA-binding LytR/AlgR family response regulator
MKVIIVDDEKYIREELKYYLEMYDDIKIVGETGAGDEVLPLVKSQTPDVIFLDINLQSDSGLIIARKLLKTEHPPLIIFVTALNGHAVEGFDIGATDYIVKPIMESRFNKCIKRIREKLSNTVNTVVEDPLINELKKIVVKKSDKLLLLDINKIIYLEYSNKAIKVVTKNQNYVLNSSLKQFIQENPHHFIRTHKSFVVNCHYIKEIIPWFNYRYKLKIKHIDDVEIPVSRTYLKHFKETFNI